MLIFCIPSLHHQDLVIVTSVLRTILVGSRIYSILSVLSTSPARALASWPRSRLGSLSSRIVVVVVVVRRPLAVRVVFHVRRPYWDPMSYVLRDLRDESVRSLKYLNKGERHGMQETRIPRLVSTVDHMIKGALSVCTASRLTVMMRMIWITVMKMPSPKRPSSTTFLRFCMFRCINTGKGRSMLQRDDVVSTYYIPRYTPRDCSVELDSNKENLHCNVEKHCQGSHRRVDGHRRQACKALDARVPLCCDLLLSSVLATCDPRQPWEFCCGISTYWAAEIDLDEQKRQMKEQCEHKHDVDRPTVGTGRDEAEVGAEQANLEA